MTLIRLNDVIHQPYDLSLVIYLPSSNSARHLYSNMHPIKKVAIKDSLGDIQFKKVAPSIRPNERIGLGHPQDSARHFWSCLLTRGPKVQTETVTPF